MIVSDRQLIRFESSMSTLQKVGIAVLIISVFGIFIGLIIFDKQLVEAKVYAPAVITILVIFFSTIYFLIRKLSDAYEKMEHMATTDDLTQLTTREHFNSIFEIELADLYVTKRIFVVPR